MEDMRMPKPCGICIYMVYNKKTAAYFGVCAKQAHIYIKEQNTGFFV